MRITTWVFLAWIAGAAMLLMPFIYAEGTVKSGIRNTEYTNRLSSACHAGVQAAEAEASELTKSGITGIWGRKDMREKSLLAFSRTLDYGFLLSDSTDNDMEIQVPLIMLVDNDGFYMTTNALFDPNASAGGAADEVYRSSFQNESQNGEIRTWAEGIGAGGTWTVRYCLNDYLFLVSPSGRIYQGFRTDADFRNEVEHDHDAIGDTVLSHFLWADTDYNRHKTDKIIEDIRTNLQYFANEKNYYGGRNGDGYDITMPTVADEDWHRLLENPTVLAFIQGKNIKTGATEINTYAYSGGEVIPADRYFITENASGDKTYHSLRYSRRTGETTFSGGDYHYGADSIEMFYSTMRDCATLGAEPCSRCVRASVQE